MRRLVPLLLACSTGAAWAADDVEALKQRVADLEQEVIELKARSVPYSALLGDGVSVSCWNPLDERGNLKPAMRQLLSLSDPEATAVDAALAEARARIAEAVAAQKPQPEVANLKLKLGLRPFPEAGKKAQDALKKTIADALGHDRAALFDKLADSQLGGPLLHFGQADYTFTVERAAFGYNYQVEHKSGGGSGSSSGSSMKLDDDFDLVKPYIPAQFGGTAGAEPAPAAPTPPPPAKPRAEF